MSMRREVDYREACVCKGNPGPTVGPCPSVVGSAMAEGRGHRVNGLGVDLAGWGEGPYDSAHIALDSRRSQPKNALLKSGAT